MEVDYEMDLEVSVSNWNDIKFSDIHHKLDALHARNRLYSEFLDNNDRLPNELQIHFG